MSRDHPPQTWVEATWDEAKEPAHPDPHTAATREVHTAAARLPVTVALTDVQRLRMAAELTDGRRTADRTTVLPRPRMVVARTAGQCRLTAAVELRLTVAAATAGLRLPMVVAGLRLTVVAERHPLAAEAAQADTAAVAVVTHLPEVEATAAAEVVVATAVAEVAVVTAAEEVVVVTAAVDITKRIFT